MHLWFLAHIASTLYMTGLIWFVQVVHYPLHAHVGQKTFLHYQHLHMNWTGYVVGPAMLVELASTLYFLFNPVHGIPYQAFVTGAVLLFIIWGSTGLLQVPFHNSLLQSFSASAHQKLVLSNWVRTIAWTSRAALVLYMISTLLKQP